MAYRNNVYLTQLYPTGRTQDPGGGPRILLPMKMRDKKRNIIIS